MSEAIIVALISAFVSIVGSVTAVMATQKVKKDKMMEEQQKANEELKNEVKETLKAHREEYISKISAVEKSISKMETVYEKETAVISLKISDLQKSQDKHNSVIERTYKLEQKTAVQEEMIKVANHRIEDLERDVTFKMPKEAQK